MLDNSLLYNSVRKLFDTGQLENKTLVNKKAGIATENKYSANLALG